MTDVLQEGARKMWAQAIEAEVESFLCHHSEIQHDLGQQQVVRNGYLPERTIQCRIGHIAVRWPRERDRNGSGNRLFLEGGVAALP